MWYFAYAQDLNRASVREWFDDHSARLPRFGSYRPATIANHRLDFWNYSHYWQGGVAGIYPSVGKNVSGGLVNISMKTIARLAEMSGHLRPGEPAGRALVEVAAYPYDGASPVRAVALSRFDGAVLRVPPARAYLWRMIDAAHVLGLSSIWIMHLSSFAFGGDIITAAREPFALRETIMARSRFPKTRQSIAV